MFISHFLFFELPINVLCPFFYWRLNAFLIYLYKPLISSIVFFHCVKWFFPILFSAFSSCSGLLIYILKFLLWSMYQTCPDNCFFVFCSSMENQIFTYFFNVYFYNDFFLHLSFYCFYNLLCYEVRIWFFPKTARQFFQYCQFNTHPFPTYSLWVYIRDLLADTEAEKLVTVL